VGSFDLGSGLGLSPPSYHLAYGWGDVFELPYDFVGYALLDAIGGPQLLVGIIVKFGYTLD
jgi:hypothetical protein